MLEVVLFQFAKFTTTKYPVHCAPFANLCAYIKISQIKERNLIQTLDVNNIWRENTASYLAGITIANTICRQITLNSTYIYKEKPTQRK